ncbi:succinate dehydrogenase cytochrome b subunit [Euhalothece natronophila Z-M001]|uniref:Succinate dehydrogenase cytochrome b subunit n=1 Tax=Euhalothece natronophila Z-M001 TaxID=522448 RepID=A0A5B8NH80_9CHRO|nr:succinate dehydrogenase cytochrome b subunit [Euhalothece natronophila]QDZ38542.1 succinate dehydrogenase cytochrome b subunit [Euhalothece natronophila Z-M001]
MSLRTSRKIPSLVKKYLMALTGIALMGFVFAHMVGNLQMFVSPEAMNQYAYFLHHVIPSPLRWAFRLGLLLMVGLHIWMAALLKLENRAARPQKYVVNRWLQASSASRYMGISGFILLVYIIFHLLHFTVQSLHPEFQMLTYEMEEKTVQDVYAMMIYGFSSQFWYISGFYIIAMGLLCWHLSHGANSIFQTLGLRNERIRYHLHEIAWWFGTILFLGFTSIPFAVLIAETSNILLPTQPVLAQIETWDGESPIIIDYSQNEIPVQHSPRHLSRKMGQP